jgi:hypothetical protein
MDALGLLREGFSVMPIERGTKRPLTRWTRYQKKAMTESQVQRTWADGVALDVAIICGAVSGNLFVLDVDDLALARQIEAEFAGKTRLVRTPRGGLHVYVRTRLPGHSGPLVAGVADTKGEGGYVVAPPSQGYELICEAPLLEVSDDGGEWALSVLADHGVQLGETPAREPRRLQHLGEINAGTRNATLFRFACLLRRYGATADLIHSGLRGINEGMCVPPLEESELQEVARKAARYEPTFPDVLNPPPEESNRRLGGPIWVPFSDIEPLATQWLWRPRVARRTLTLLAGEPGTAKTWLLLFMASVVSRGACWPFSEENSPLGSVLILNAEDDPAMTIRPRLDALRANLKKIRILKGSFDLCHDLNVIERGVHSQSDTEFVIVDPLFSFTGNTDVNAPARTRALLQPLADLAAKHGFAVMLNMHLNKKEELSGVNRIMASKDLAALPRSILMTAEDRNQRGLFHLFHVKLNLDEPRARTLTLTFENRRLRWVDESDLRVDDFICGQAQARSESTGKLAQARAFLEGILRDGPRLESEIERDASQEGFSPSTLWRAKKALRIRSTKRGAAWEWRLSERSRPENEGDVMRV